MLASPFVGIAGWTINRVGELCDLLNGLAFKPSDWGDRGIPIIRIQNLNGGADFNYCSRAIPEAYLIPAGSLLFSWSGNRGTSFGPFVWRGKTGALNQHIFKVTPKAGVNPNWLFYALNFVRMEAEKNAHGGLGLVHVRRGDMESYEVLTPRDIDEQSRIATILDASEAAIRASEVVIEKMRAQRRGLLADRVAAFTTHPELYDPAALADLTIPNVPICYGVVQPGPHHRNGVPLITITDLLGNLDQGLHRISRNLDSQYARSRVAAGDLLLSIKATVGRLRVLPPGFFGNISRDIARIRCSERMQPAYLLFYFQSAHGRQSLASIQVGSTRAELSISRLLKLMLPVPSIAIQNEIIAVVSSSDSAIAAGERRLAKLRLQHQGILHDLLTGRVRTTAAMGSVA